MEDAMAAVVVKEDNNASADTISSSSGSTLVATSTECGTSTGKVLRGDKLPAASSMEAKDIKEATFSRECVVASGAVGAERRLQVHFEEKTPKVVEGDCEVSELLGSVITHNCPGTRTSARVIQKMKQEQERPITPPPLLEARDAHTRKEDREKVDKPEKADKPKTLSTAPRSLRPAWTNVEKNLFFDALNEFGKDFDAIENYITTRLRRRNIVDMVFKTKDQVRQHYYATFHKLCKYVRFSDEIRKPTQELYALINYGEMRRKLQFVTDKHFMKLKKLVYHGHITVRYKGKNVRVKTPSCKALRKLNQLDDCVEDIRLPTKIEVQVRPANVETFTRVQMLAQNPRVSCVVPLHKKLGSFIKMFEHKWRSRDHRLAEKEHKMFSGRNISGDPVVSESSVSSSSNCVATGPDKLSAAAAALDKVTSTSTPDKVTSSTAPAITPAAAVTAEKVVTSSSAAYKDAEMCFMPKPGVTIHRPLLSITEHLSSGNICLTAYEERLGVEVHSENVPFDRSANKRARTESGSEKPSPEAKKAKVNGGVSPPHQRKDGPKGEPAPVDLNVSVASSAAGCSGDEICDELIALLNDPSTDAAPEQADHGQANISMGGQPAGAAVEVTTTTTTTTSSVPPAQKSSKRASKKPTVPTTTPNFKPLLSEDVIRSIRRGWTVSNAADITIGDLYVVFGRNSRLDLRYYWTKPLPGTVEPDVFLQKQPGMAYNPNDCEDAAKLKTLSHSSLNNKLKHLLLIANLSKRIQKKQCSCNASKDSHQSRFESFVSNKTFNPDSRGGEMESGVFRTPMIPMRRPMIQMDPVKQLAMLSRQKNSRHLLVQRLIMPGGGANRWMFESLEEDNNKEEVVKEKSPSTTTPIPVSPMSKNPWRTADFLMERRQARCQALNSQSPASAMTRPKPPATMTSASTQTMPLGSRSDDEGTVTVGSEAKPSQSPASSSSGSGSSNFVEAFKTRKCEDAGRVSDSAFDESSNASTNFGSMTPMHLLRDSTSNSRWLEENLNDFSLTSLLGHLDDITGSRDILDPSSNISVISESSVDYMHKFQEIAALLQSQEKD